MKKKQWILLLGFIPSVVLAQPPALTQEQMDSMMQNIQKMQSCFANIDQGALQKLANQGQTMQQQLKTLCDSGNRSKAQQEAVKFAQEYIHSKEVKQLRECGKQMANYIPNIPELVKDIENTDKHICDTYK